MDLLVSAMLICAIAQIFYETSRSWCCRLSGRSLIIISGAVRGVRSNERLPSTERVLTGYSYVAACAAFPEATTMAARASCPSCSLQALPWSRPTRSRWSPPTMPGRAEVVCEGACAYHGGVKSTLDFLAGPGTTEHK
jgi:hypothetical protein